MHCAPDAIDMSSKKGFAFCVKRDRVQGSVVHRRTTNKDEAVIGTDREAVIQAIREARKRAGLTQEQAAALAGRATSTISRWESGALPNTWDDLISYAHALNQPMSFRFGRNEEAPQPPKWAEGLERRLAGELQLNRRLIESLLPSEMLTNADELIRRLEAQLRTRGEAPPGKTGSPGPDEGSPQAQADESPPVRDGEH